MDVGHLALCQDLLRPLSVVGCRLSVVVCRLSLVRLRMSAAEAAAADGHPRRRRRRRRRCGEVARSVIRGGIWPALKVAPGAVGRDGPRRVSSREAAAPPREAAPAVRLERSAWEVAATRGLLRLKILAFCGRGVGYDVGGL